MRIKWNGVWKYIRKTIRIKFGGLWRGVRGRYLKVDGRWRQLVPANAVILYQSLTYCQGSVKVCDGTDGTINMMNRYVRMDSNIPAGSLSGPSVNLTHSGSLHGAGSSTTTSYSMLMADPSIAFTNSAADTNYSHSHTVGSHTHTGEDTPDLRHVALIPTLGGDVIYRDAIMLKDSNWYESFSTNMMTRNEFTNMYIKLAAAYANRYTGFESHGHGQVNMNTSTWTASTNQKQPNSENWLYSHYHSANHVMAGANVSGPVSLRCSAGQINRTIFFDELPSGTYILLLDDVVPYGWTLQNETKMLRFKGADSPAESDTHYHSGWRDTGYATPVTYHKGNSGTKSEWILHDHYHSFTDSHTGAAANFPPYVIFRLARKS